MMVLYIVCIYRITSPKIYMEFKDEKDAEFKK